MPGIKPILVPAFQDCVWLPQVEQWHDDIMGPDFRSAWQATGCTAQSRAALDRPACYWAFARDRGFANHIQLGPRSFINAAVLFNALLHERIHALQFSKAAILHCSPDNWASDLLLCPADHLWVSEMAERDAYAKACTATLLAAERHGLQKNEMGAIDEIGVAAGLGPARFSPLYLKAFADAVLDHRWDGVTVKDNYDWDVLEAETLCLHHRMRHRPASFMRLELEDLFSIGQSFGVNFLAANGRLATRFQERPVIAEETAAVLRRVNREFGIVYDELPTFGAALEARGLTRESFLAMSRAQKPALAPTAPYNNTGPR